MQLRYGYRVCPNGPQCTALGQAFGCALVVWNDCLRDRKQAHAAELSRVCIAQAKRTTERGWLTGVSAVVLQQSLRDLDTAFKNFFDSINGKRKGPKVAPPCYKSKKDTRQSIRLNTNAFCLNDDGTVCVAKAGDLKVTWSRPLPVAPTSLTLAKDSSGRYFMSFVVDAEVGIDLGLTTFAVLSDGTRIHSPKFLRRAEKKLRRLQKDLSRKAKASKNRARARIKVARQHARVAGRRRDFHHKASTQIIRDNQAVFVEDLAVSGLGKTRLNHAGVQSGQARAVLRQDRPVRADLPGLLRVRPQGRTQTPARPGMDLQGVRDGPRPRRERGTQHPGRRTGGQAKRLAERR